MVTWGSMRRHGERREQRVTSARPASVDVKDFGKEPFLRTRPEMPYSSESKPERACLCRDCLKSLGQMIERRDLGRVGEAHVGCDLRSHRRIPGRPTHLQPIGDSRIENACGT
jgi:hypothetical protein